MLEGYKDWSNEHISTTSQKPLAITPITCEMKLFNLAASLLLLVPAIYGLTDDEIRISRQQDAPGSEALLKRACVATPCKCTYWSDGLHCGDGAFNCVHGHVYQCGGGGTKSCDYGVRKTCQQCDKLSC